MITLAVQCHHFQRRLCWLLSSLAQQTRPDIVTLDVACVPGNGSPTTEEVLDEFTGSVTWKLSDWPSVERFQYRGLVRNLQLQQCADEWLMFGDCDMVYHPRYFEDLLAVLEGSHRGAAYMLSSGRVSNPKDDANVLVNGSEAVVGKEVLRAYERADTLKKVHRSNVGAGFCQLVNKRTAPHSGYYVEETENRDWSWSKRGSNPRSDMQFRKRIAKLGGPRQALPEWFSRSAIHLNHNRDPEAGRHLEEQR